MGNPRVTRDGTDGLGELSDVNPIILDINSSKLD